MERRSRAPSTCATLDHDDDDNVDDDIDDGDDHVDGHVVDVNHDYPGDVYILP